VQRASVGVCCPVSALAAGGPLENLASLQLPTPGHGGQQSEAGVEIGSNAG